MRILIVRLSSLGDVVHALPVVDDIRRAHPEAAIDWVAEPAFVPVLQRTRGVARAIAMPLRQAARDGWFAASTRKALGAALRALRAERYDAVIDLQGLAKSALVAWAARGPRWGLANRTEGSSHEWPARVLATHAVRIEPRVHALDRSRLLVQAALDTRIDRPPEFGLHAGDVLPAAPETVVLVHGTSREDKLWPEDRWIALGRRLVAAGWRIALPQADDAERARAGRIAVGIARDPARRIGQPAAIDAWPRMGLGALIDRMAATGGAIGVDSGPSHLATALGLPHVQIYNHPTSWRTGPQLRHGHLHQVSIEGDPVPSVEAVWASWQALPKRSAPR